jgi:hypothetical protein
LDGKTFAGEASGQAVEMFNDDLPAKINAEKIERV